MPEVLGKTQAKYCSICNLLIEPDEDGWAGGHSAKPINDGICCGGCNKMMVEPAQMRQFFASQKA